MNTATPDSAYPVARVRDLPARERPRELFDRLGAAHVPDSVLLALVLRSGVSGVSVVDLADQLLRRYGSLTGLARANVDELAALRGMGRVKAQIVRAALELARRLAEESAPARTPIRAPADAARVLRERARGLQQEHFWALLLDARNRLQAAPVEISRGLLDASLVHPREVFREAVRAACAAVVLAHNHPSGDPTPSAEDVRITRQLVEAGRVLDIRVLDHVILGLPAAGAGRDFCSLQEAGLVNFNL